MAKKIEDYEWFCPQPFINVVEQITGVVKPCCVIKGWDLLLMAPLWKIIIQKKLEILERNL